MFNCISTPKISLINESPEGFFNISRGIRKGDLIYSFLFIIMVEAFGRSIKKAREVSFIKGVITTEEIPRFTHQQFVDDMILTGESS